MKKMICGMVMLFLLVASLGMAQTAYHPSGSKAADALIWSGSGIFQGIAIATDGTNAVTVSIYDNTSASGSLLVPTFVATTSATDRVRSFFAPVFFNTGCYVDITTSGTVGYEVYFTR